jgi:hypothetical protein
MNNPITADSTVVPLSGGDAIAGSTTFNSRIKTYDDLKNRIQMTLGAPLIQIELSDTQIYNNIDIACEFFTKFAGTTEEFLIFDSLLYNGKFTSNTDYTSAAAPGAGLYMPMLFNETPGMTLSDDASGNAPGCDGYDQDLGSARRVLDVYSFAEGSSSGVNVLFTMEHTIAQQAYFGHLLGNVGYDLITWQALKTWIDTREKMLGMMPYLRFNPDTQYLKIIPEPSPYAPYMGLIGCKVQKPLKHIVNQLWVYRYSLALCKITMGHVRGKYTGTNLFGGQTVNAADVMQQGLAEKAELEKEIMTDLVDRDPIKFFIG